MVYVVLFAVLSFCVDQSRLNIQEIAMPAATAAPAAAASAAAAEPAEEVCKILLHAWLPEVK